MKAQVVHHNGCGPTPAFCPGTKVLLLIIAIIIIIIIIVIITITIIYITIITIASLSPLRWKGGRSVPIVPPEPQHPDPLVDARQRGQRGFFRLLN